MPEQTHCENYPVIEPVSDMDPQVSSNKPPNEEGAANGLGCNLGIDERPVVSLLLPWTQQDNLGQTLD